MTRVVWLAAVAAAVVVPPAGRAAVSDARVSTVRAGAVTNVSVASASGRTEVAIAYDGEVEVSDFVLTAPHRIVVDFEPATLRMMPKLYDGVVRGGITSVRVAQTKPNVVRVVLDIDRARPYFVARDLDGVRVTIDEPAEGDFAPWSMVPAPRTAAAPTPPPANPPVVPVVPVVERAAAATPVVTAAKIVPPQQTGPNITISFSNTPLRDVLAQFAAFSGVSIVSSSTLGNILVTAEIVDKPWPVALSAILQSQGLAAVTEASGIIRVDSYANIQARAAAEPLVQRLLPLNYAKAADLQPTVQALLSRECFTGGLQLVGAPPEATADAGAAGGDAGGGAPPVQQPPTQQLAAQPQQPPAGGCVRGSVVAEPQTNQLIITEVASRIDSLVSYAASFDVRTPQVNISVKLISINRTTTNQLGLSYDLGSTNAFFNTLAPRTVNGTPQQTEFTVALGGDAFAGVANAGRQFGGTAALNLIYNTTIGNWTLTSFLDALTQEELSDIQTQSSVNTLDKKAAEIFVGNEFSFLLTPPTAPGAIQAAPPQITTREFGNRLTATPSIAANRMIRLTVAVEQSTLTSVTIAGPQTSQRTATTEVLVADGETAVIGGLTQSSATKTRRGIPLLMQLPLIGKLFSENESIERKDDLLVLITPKIIDDPVPVSGRN
jgi:type IV pilus assembly protein PilQ